MKDRFLIWLYKHTPAKMQSQVFIDAVGRAADREIARTRQRIIKKRWEKVRLQDTLIAVKNSKTS